MSENTISEKIDILSAEKINGFLGELKNWVNITVLPTVNSTNLLLKEMATNGADEGTVIISSHQTCGRGRFTRSFHSPSDSGIYMSILLRPNINAKYATLITTATAVAVSEAIENLSGKTTGIKWVNDIFINSKKVCGILTEASFNLKTLNTDYAVVGIGINAYEPSDGFPDEIKDIAGSIFSKKMPNLRNKLTAEIIKNIFKYYNTLNEKNFIENYKKRCIVLGKKINVINNNSVTPATALDIDDECRLIVQYDNGDKAYLSSGEISIKL